MGRVCRFLHRVFDHHRTDWAAHPLDPAEQEWRRLKAEHPVTFLHDAPPAPLVADWGLESGRRENETYFVDPFWQPGDPL